MPFCRIKWIGQAELLDVMREYEKLQPCTQSVHISFDSWGNQVETMLKITPSITDGEYNTPKAPFPVTDIAQNIYQPWTILIPWTLS